MKVDYKVVMMRNEDIHKKEARQRFSLDGQRKRSPAELCCSGCLKSSFQRQADSGPGTSSIKSSYYKGGLDGKIRSNGMPFMCKKS